MNKPTIGYIKGLDILRFIAAAGVVLHHTSIQLEKKNLEFLTMFREVGGFFLDLFFVISGFLIAAILFREMDSGKFNLKNFFIRRILRIWPMYFFVVLLFMLVIPLIKGLPGGDIAHNMFYASFFITNYQLLFSTVSKSTYMIIWSVCIEEHIYIIFPFLMYVLGKNKMVLSLLLIVLGFVSWLIIPSITGALPSGINVPYFFTTSYFYYFGAGCLLSVLLTKKGTLSEKVDKVLFHPVVQVIIIIAGCIFEFGAYSSDVPTALYLVINGAFVSYLVYCAANQKIIFNWFPEKLSRFLGNVSYPMYLLHIYLVLIGIFLVRKIGSPTVFNYDALLPVIVIGITVIVSFLCHLLIERPFLKLKKKYTIVSNK